MGIGYETPWRQVEAMLLEADNAFCDDAHLMARLYTALHQNILDVFNEHGVQIMTPAYEGDPAEPKVVPKDQWHLSPARLPLQQRVSHERHAAYRHCESPLGLGLSAWPAVAGAQSVGDVFRSAAPSVVVIRARGRDVDASGQTRFSETGSGVLISADGR